MDCKNALTEADGDIDKAVELLRVKMGNKLGKLADREAAEGTVQSYIHATGKVGVLVEVDCNTDFVARNDDFIALRPRHRDARRRVAADASASTSDEVAAGGQGRRAARLRAAGRREGKPENIRPKIVEGKLNKWLDEVVLLDQVHVNADKHEGKTIEQIRGDLSAKTGENVVIRRFTRFAVGE